MRRAFVPCVAIYYSVRQHLCVPKFGMSVTGLTGSQGEQYHLNYRNPEMPYVRPKDAPRSKPSRISRGAYVAVSKVPVVAIAGKTRLVWERMDGETPRAYEAFCVYRDFPSEDPPVKRSYNQMQFRGFSRTSCMLWSNAHNWVTRAAAYDDYMEGRLRKRLEESRLRMKERQVKLGISMQDMAQVSLQTGVIQPESVSDIVKLAESGTRIERLAQGESTENVAQGISIVWSGPAPSWAPALAAAMPQKEGADVEDAEWSEVTE